MGSNRSEAIAELEAIFRPRAIAVVGASANPETQGHDYVRCLLEFGYGGAIYPVNPGVDETLGLPAYPSVRDVPGPVDYVISCIPAAAVLPLIEDCGYKGVRAVHFFTGRFSETGRQDAARLERELRERASQLGVRIIGPNCMGLYHPGESITFRTNFPREPGSVAFLSQSGGNAVELVYHGAQRGLRFSKVISYGNALDLDEVDFLDYFAQDDETRVVAAYVEGVKDGRRSLAALRRAAASKPLVVLKGGRTDAGTRAAASHTAALAGAGEVWSAAVRQAGALEVSTLDDAIDMLVSFSFLCPGTGLRVGVVGGGGGRTVQSADICEEAGLTVVQLPPEIRQELRERVPEIWDWVSNPVDQSILGGFPIGATGLLEMMAGSPHFDVLIANVGEDWPLGRPGGDALVRHVAKRFGEIGRDVSKPLALVLGPPDSPEERRWHTIIEAQQTLVAAGLAVYPTVERAARAVSRFVQYCREREERG